MFGFWLAVVEGTLLGFDAQRVIAGDENRCWRFFGPQRSQPNGDGEGLCWN
jgi:hypothetical protein